MLTLVVAIACGLTAGYALGGRLRNLERLHLSSGWLVLVALAVQLVIFSPLGDPLGKTAPIVLHLATYALILLFAVVNRRNAGVLIAGAGAALNGVVIAANGGFMPASRAALEFAGLAVTSEPHNNSAVADGGAHLLFLGDVMAVPDGLPLVANVFSIGDLLIVLGVATLLATAMRAEGDERAPMSHVTDGEPEAQ